jgi:Ca2+-binding RTX toxin-like protein
MKLSAADLAFLNAQTLFGANPPAGTDPFSLEGLRNVDGTNNNISGVTAADGFVDQFGAPIDTARFGNKDQAFSHAATRHFRPNYTQGVGAAGNVTDSSPRIISNLVVDATAGNPAAVGVLGNPGDPALFITPFSSWFTIFGQFLDHGLDFINKGGNGTVTIPLPPGDPLLAFGPPSAMFLTRASVVAGENINSTAPLVDQSQTYGSSKATSFYLHEYNAAGLETGRVVTHAGGGMATWADIKANALLKGIVLTDADVNNIPEPIPGATPTTWTRGAGTGQMFLADIAHTANPYTSAGVLKTADTDGVIGITNPVEAANPLIYDEELLNAHFVAGDPRVNENVALSAIHEVFHNEHNRLVGVITEAIAQQDQIQPGFAASWDGARIFEAAKIVNEMQYQHMVFEEFARRMSPNIDAFANYNVDLNPNLTAEFSQAVFRLGHSMLTDTVHMTDAAGGVSDMTLISAFLNPVAFNATGAADIAQGMSQQQGNQIDEFVVDAVRNFLVGLPLDLAALNIARGRDVGLGSLNEVRTDLFAQTGDPSLAAYTSWTDFGANMLHPASLVNFIAAYSTDGLIIAARNAGNNTLARSLATTAMGDAAFMNGGDTGFNQIDLWLGGLAESKVLGAGLSPGMLGSTFDFLFAQQMIALQNGDRLYYLARLGGTNILAELDGQRFGDIVARGTGATHLNGDIFGTADQYLELSSQTARNSTDGALVAADGTFIAGNFVKNAAQNAAVLHEVIGGSNANNTMDGGAGNDTLWGDGGIDTLRGGLGNDQLNGGDGNDILTDVSGDDFLRGDAGDDNLNGGLGIDVLVGGSGNDTMDGGSGTDELFGGEGNDIMRGGDHDDTMQGDEGDDNMDGGLGLDALDGGIGNDVLKGGAGADLLTGGDDNDYLIGGGDADGLDGGLLGHDIASYETSTVGLLIDMAGTFIGTGDARGDTFLSIEEVRGTSKDDQIFGDLANNTLVGGTGVDQLDGRDGNDTLIGGTGNDAMVGGLGVDTAFFSGTRAGYSFSIATPSVITDINVGDGDTGTDSISGIEFLQFSDQIISTATGQVAAPLISLTNSTPLLMNGTTVFDSVMNTLVVNDGTALTGTGLTVATILVAEPGVPPAIAGVRAFAVLGEDAASFVAVPDGLGGTVLKLIGGGPTSFVNFEAKPHYHVIVQVTDNLGTDSIEYTLNVTDLNDNRASITSGNHVNVQENIANNVVVYRVAGTDLDTVGPALAYSLVTGVGGEDNARFAMVNGELHFVASPNFEAPLDANADNVYNVLVGVSDGVGAPTTKAVQIAVSNVAEGGPNVPPVITSNGGGATAATAIDENLTAVTTVTATDTDLPAQALTFSLVAGNDSAAFTINPTSGALSFLTAPNFEAPTDIGLDNVYDVTVRVSDGNGGFDTQAIAVTVNNVVVEGPVTITGDNNANVLNGTAAADIILGLDGDDTIHGNGGGDTITGGLGKDALFGDAGADTFVFDSVTETPTGSANRDVIGDFVHLTDTMDLTAIDARTGSANPGDQAFRWIGLQGFHGVRGELHYAQTNNAGTANDFTIVSGDRNGDRVADFQIQLTGLVTVNVADFNL